MSRCPIARASAPLAAVLAIVVATPAFAQRGPQPQRRPTQNPLRFEMMGPAAGGRISAIAGVPGDPKTWYVGNASGGVWKSSDSGTTFRPVFDSMPVQAIGALAVAPSNHAMVWAGTGEAWAIRDADVMGDGVYLSADSGKTWKNMGLRETGRIGRIIVHPRDPKIVYVCALGRATGPQEEHGVYRTTDGGATWTRVLGLGGNYGCSGLALDAKNPRVLFAGMWHVIMHTYAMYSGTHDAKAGIYVSRDGGDTWKQVVSPGLPHSPIGKIDIAVAPSNSKRVYALIQTADQGSLWRSDDGGVTWRDQNWNRALIGRAGYYIRLAVSPKNADEILVANSSFFRSMDGGKTFEEVPWGGDNHDIWYDPTNADRIGLTNDLGARLTTSHGKAWKSVTLPNGQMYHVAVDNQVPYWIYSNRQDNGTMRGPSTAPEGGAQGGAFGGFGRGPRADTTSTAPSTKRKGPLTKAARDSIVRDSVAKDSTARARAKADSGRAPAFTLAAGGASEWDHGLGGCESGFTLPDLTDPDIVWASCYGNTVTRWDAKTKLARSVSPWIHTLDSPPTDTKYRCHWTPPLAIDPFDHETVYYGCQLVFKTSNGGQSWTELSPDLSTRDTSRIVSSGGIVADNLGQFYGEVVFAIAPSEIQQGLIWAGTNDGQLWYTRDGGANWTNVTANVTGLPAWGTVRKIEPSHFDPATAYVAVDFHMMDDRKPYVFKTTDFGKTWTNITSDLPADHPLDYVMSVAENPNQRGMLFAGTGHAFYYSMDDGAHWTRYSEGLPAAPVTWIVVPKQWHDVVVSTYGRGLYIMRDITALEQGTTLAQNEDARLYAPHPGFRQARSGRAEFTFALRQASKTPLKLEVLDSTGAVVRHGTVLTRAGLNRAFWNLEYDPARRVELRTTPAENPHIWEETRFKYKDTRPITHWGIQGPENAGPLAAPGHYAVRLTVDGKSYTQPFAVMKDDRIKSSDADLVASTQTQIRVRNDMDTTAAMVNKLELMRRQIEAQRKAGANDGSIAAALDTLDRKMQDVELQLVSRSDLLSDDKYYVEAYKVYLNLVWLMGEVGTGAGDVAGGADTRPTDASLAVLAGIEKDLAKAESDFARLMDVDVPAFNKSMAGKIATIAAR